MSYAVGMHGSSITRVIKRTVPWLLLAVVVGVVFNALGDYRDASSNVGDKVIPAALRNPADAKTGAKAKSVKGSKVVGGKTAVKGAKTVVVVYEGLNFREAPSRVSDTVGTLKKGDRLQWLGTDNGWHKVKAPDGKVGWVAASKEYTKLVKGR